VTRPTSTTPGPAADPAVRSYVIIATAYVVPPPRSDAAPYFEIIAAPDHAKYAPRVVLRTTDPTLYARALDAEGTDARFLLSWRSFRVASRSALELLEVLAAPPPESAS